MIVVFTESAEVDLVEITANIAEDSPRRAVSFVRELRQRCEALAEMPNRYQLLPHYESKSVRRCVFGNYLIFYHVGAEYVEILHILH